MKLKGFDIFSYEIPMSDKSVRKGFIVRLTDDLGREGFGEIAPLENWSHESYQESLQFLKSIKERLLEQILEPIPFPPSVMFGIESALMQLRSPLQNDLLFNVTRLRMGQEKTALYEKDVKLKLGSYPIEEAIEITNEYLENGIRLRIDLNRMWSLKKAVMFCNHFEVGDFLYIEEPVAYFMELEPFFEQTGFNYALDEHLLFHPLDRILSLKGLSHLILKPTIQGGLRACQEIVKKCREVECIFSSALETDIGLSHIVRIAMQLNPSKPIGVDTAKYHESSLLTKPFDLLSGKISKSHYNKMPIDYTKLKLL